MRAVGVVAFALACASACAQDAAESRMQNGGTFIEPPVNVDPLYLPPPRTQTSPDGPARAAGRVPPLDLRLALDVPLHRGGGVGFASQGARAASPTLQADLRWTPVGDSRWFARVVFYRYLDARDQQPWSPDYSYSFGYEDYRPGTWSATYANYTGTRWHPDAASNQGRLNFDEGLWSVAYRFAAREDVLCRASIDWTPKFVDLATLSFGRHRTEATLGCRYSHPAGWFAEFTAYAYPERRKQQPWDPDFTYAFGWWDWRPGTVSLQYSNYSGNRFPGRARAPGEGAFRSGSVTLSWRVDW